MDGFYGQQKWHAPQKVAVKDLPLGAAAAAGTPTVPYASFFVMSFSACDMLYRAAVACFSGRVVCARTGCVIENRGTFVRVSYYSS